MFGIGTSELILIALVVVVVALIVAYSGQKHR